MSEELSRVEDLLENGVEEPVLPMSELEAILRGEKIKPHSRVAELLLQYNPQDILIEKRIDENGTYYASADNAAGYFKVIVDTPVVPPTVLDHLIETITQNGEYTYTPDHDGYSDAIITVDVPSVQPTLITKTITENGTYDPTDDNADGYSNVTVDVASGGIESPFYDFHTAADGKIVVRRKFTKLLDNTWDIETLWFINGFHFDEFLTDIPPSLLEFALKNTDVSGKAYDDDTSETTNGWISISRSYYRDKLACYTTDWYQNSNVDMWCVIDINNGNQQVLDWSDPYDIPVTPEPVKINYNADDLLVGSSSGTYITSNFDKPLEEGKIYIGALKDKGNFTNVPIFFKRAWGDQYINTTLAEGVGTLTITDTTASLSSYSGSYRDIYLRLSEVIEGQTY